MTRQEKIPPIFRTKLEAEIIPELIEAGQRVLASYEQDTENYSNYMIGCCCWDNVFTRLERICATSDFFHGIPHKKVLEINAMADGVPISFYVSRVAPETRIPPSGRSIKRVLQGQLFLSEELSHFMTDKGIYTLGYDISAQQGFGKITFDLLTPVGHNAYQAVTIFTFDVDINSGTYKNVTPEEITRKQITRISHRDLTREQGSPKKQRVK